jgi:hypothetical protein
MSRIAPPPALPIRDVKIDTGIPLPCDAPRPALLPVGPRADGHPVVTQDTMVREAWVRPSDASTPIRRSVRHTTFFDARVPLSPGFGPGVFRPPRA